ncbi:MAG: hypothetical protein JO097_21475 [Acidobacteriaceae bacterium]|nr:hypothetical protein [Acidobacteriaceae bacterium]
MNGKKSREAVLEFQDYQASKGLLARGTAMARKIALGKVLGILNEDEAQDVTKVDLDDLMLRFSNLQGKDYTPGSMMTYKSRVKAALEDFDSYLANPLGFRPSVNRRDKGVKADRSGVSKKVGSSRAAVQPSAETLESTTSKPVGVGFAAENILPIPLRADLTVRIQGLPFDMTKAEAEKIANVVKAMAMGE